MELAQSRCSDMVVYFYYGREELQVGSSHKLARLLLGSILGVLSGSVSSKERYSSVRYVTVV